MTEHRRPTRDSAASIERLFADPGKVDDTSRRLLLCGCAVAVVAIAAVDYRVHHELSLSLFYLFPIASAAWLGGRRIGLAFAVGGAGLWAASDQLSGHTYSHWALPYWNAGVRLAYFAIAAELLCRLQHVLTRERQESETDPLTGVFNRAGWFEAAELELARLRRHAQPIAIAYIDLDNFKAVNDSRGHGEGDQLLGAVARTIRSSVRRSDAVARIGGDEFVVLLPEASADAAKAVVDKLHLALTRAMEVHRWPVGFSIGIAAFSTPPGSVQDIVSAADRVMYDVKRGGKNAVRLVIC